MYSGYKDKLWMPILLLLDISGNIEWRCDKKLLCLDKERYTFD